MESYWDLSNPQNEKTKDTLDFIQQQADMLGKQTGGAVLAKFISKRISNAEVLHRVGQSIQDSNYFKVRSGHDASKLYKKKRYEFFITDASQVYELAIFELACNDEYPILLYIDSTIASESGLEQNYEIDSFSDFKHDFHNILQSNIIKYVIRKLMQMANNSAFDVLQHSSQASTFREEAAT